MGRSSVSSARSKRATAQKMKGLTHLQSLNVIRNMIRVSVSEICYLRNLFPEELFKERVYADMNVKCLAPMKDNPSQETDDAFVITQWLEDGVFEALEKKYLDSLVLCIYSISSTHQPEHLLESYTYTITHASNGSPELLTSFIGAKALNCTAENVKAQAIQLIRSLVSITNNLDPLPRNRLITMKVFFNDTCPADWQPKHFKNATAEYTNQVKAPSLKLDVGRVITPHHLVTMQLEMAEESMESLSQVGSQSGVSQSYDQPDDESDVTTLGTGNTALQEATAFVPATPLKLSEQISARPAAVTPPREVTKGKLLTFLVSSSTVETQTIMAQFPRKSSSKIKRWLLEFENAGVLRKQPNSSQYEVTAHDSEHFYRAIHETHGKMKRQITVNALAQAMDIHVAQAEALLARMDREGLVAQVDSSFNVVFSEANRALIRTALQANKVKAAIVINDQPPAPAQNGVSVYDFEPHACITPARPSKRKSPNASTSSARSAAMPSRPSAVAKGSCANAPILQVRKALKKRKLALKPIG